MINDRLNKSQFEFEKRVNKYFSDYVDKFIGKKECNNLITKEIEDSYRGNIISRYDYDLIYKRENRKRNGEKRTIVDMFSNFYYNHFLDEQRIFDEIFDYFKRVSRTPVFYKRLSGDTFWIYLVNVKYRDNSPFRPDYEVLNFNSNNFPIEIKKFFDVHEFKLSNLISYVKSGAYLFLENTLSKKYYLYSPVGMSRIIDLADGDFSYYRGQECILIFDKKNKNNMKINFTIDFLKSINCIKEYDKKNKIFLKNNIN